VLTYRDLLDCLNKMLGRRKHTGCCEAVRPLERLHRIGPTFEVQIFLAGIIAKPLRALTRRGNTRLREAILLAMILLAIFWLP